LQIFFLKMSNNWNFNAKSVYLTYSQIGFWDAPGGYDDLSQFLEFGTLDELVEWCADEWSRFTTFMLVKFDRALIKGGVAFEKHEDGSPHVHIIAEMDKKLHSRDVNAMDDFYSQHPNWRSVKNWTKGIKYLSKGPYFFFSFDHEEFLKKNGSRPKKVSDMLNAGKTIKDVNAEEDLQSYVMVNLEKLRKYHDQLSDWQTESLAISPERDLTKFLTTLKIENDDLLDWIKLNVFDTPTRPMRQHQLWLHGPTGIGKTTFAMRLEELGYKVYWYPINDGKWMDNFDDTFDLIVIDEFNGQLTIQWLNALVAGGPVNCPRRGRKPFLKRKNIPVIVTSNYDITGCFRKTKNDDPGLLACQTRFFELYSNSYLCGL
jgi:hypothetical protein